MCNACHPKMLHCTTARKSTSGTDLRRLPVGAEQTDKISNIHRDKKSFTIYHSLWLLPSSLLPALRGDPTTGLFTLKQKDAFPFAWAPWTESPPAQVLAPGERGAVPEIERRHAGHPQWTERLTSGYMELEALLWSLICVLIRPSGYLQAKLLMGICGWLNG